MVQECRLFVFPHSTRTTTSVTLHQRGVSRSGVDNDVKYVIKDEFIKGNLSFPMQQAAPSVHFSYSHTLQHVS